MSVAENFRAISKYLLIARTFSAKVKETYNDSMLISQNNLRAVTTMYLLNNLHAVPTMYLLTISLASGSGFIQSVGDLPAKSIKRKFLPTCIIIYPKKPT